MYRAVFLTLAILAGISVRAEAQDRWGGLYAGLSFDSSEATGAVDGTGFHDHDSKSRSLGVYGGYNFTRPGSGFVWGPELSLTGLSSSSRQSGDGLGSSEIKGSYLLSPRLRAGYATERVFFYGMLGFGVTGGGVKPTDADGTQITIGGGYGLGAEIALQNGWSTRIDAEKYNFGSPNYDFNGSSRDTEFEVRRISIGLTRKF